jgi:signal transduction histidine kinase
LLSRIPLAKISFRGQIMLLGIVAVVLLLGVLFATFAALRYTKSAVLKDDQRQLSEATNSLVREYTNKADVARLSNEPQLLESASAEPSQDTLTSVSRMVLQNVDGVEGGFYALAGDMLVGYSFPTRSAVVENSGREDIPAAERPMLAEVARDAASSHVPSERVLATGGNVTLIDALPLRIGQRYVGSAWAMKRLPGIPGANRFRTYLIAVGLGIAAFACVILTLLVVRGLQSGVRKIEGGLKSLEHNLASQIPIDGDPDEIRQIARAINRLGTTLKGKMESEKQIEDRLRHAERLAALGRLIAGVAHEVRNPLATIRLRVQMCQDSENPDVRNSCGVALQEIERLNGMVNRLLSFSRPVHLHPEPTNLNGLVEQRLDNFSERAQRSGIKFITKFGPNPSAVRVDQNRMAQVFDNVIQNAIEAMSETGGTLCVNVTCEATKPENGREACVEFNDTGGGISSDVVSRVFDPFFTTKSSGTGLGLSICHELVQAHGGEINIASAEGCGTTVRILLPVHEGQTAAQVA